MLIIKKIKNLLNRKRKKYLYFNKINLIQNIQICKIKMSKSTRMYNYKMISQKNMKILSIYRK